MSIGFLAELILAYHQRDIETYSIAERTDRPKRTEAEADRGRREMTNDQATDRLRPPTPDPDNRQPTHDHRARRPSSPAAPRRLCLADRRQRRGDARADPGGRRGRSPGGAGVSHPEGAGGEARRHSSSEGSRATHWPRPLDREEPRLREKLRYERPFLSANDRSRWCTVRALVEDGHAGRGRAVRHRQGDRRARLGHDRHGQARRPPLFEQAAAAADAAGRRVLGDPSADRAPRSARIPSRSGGSCS